LRFFSGFEMMTGKHFVFECGKNDSAAALSKHEPTRPMDLYRPKSHRCTSNHMSVFIDDTSDDRGTRLRNANETARV
jgi:hypothetical protein